LIGQSPHADLDSSFGPLGQCAQVTKVSRFPPALDVHFWHYNFMRGHGSLDGATPAMAAGVVGGYLNWESLLD
jgi:hypothetical protein